MICTSRLTTTLLLSGYFILAGATGLISSAAAATSTHTAHANQVAIETALQFAYAISKGDRVTFGRLDFACQYRLISESTAAVTTYPAETDPSYTQCWQEMTDKYAHTLKRTDLGMDVLWPSAGPLAFFGDDLPDLPVSAFVMEAIGISPPGSGVHLTVTNSRKIPDGTFRIKPQGKVIGVPAILIDITVAYKDPLTSPVTYAPGNTHWESTVKRPRRALRSVGTQWVVLTDLKKHGFPGNTAVFHRPVRTKPETLGMPADIIPFTTETSHALPDSLVWWGPDDQPGTLTAATARAATFPQLSDRIALLNRILMIDPRHIDALTVLTRHLYTELIEEARTRVKLSIKDQALALAVSEFYWNIYAAGTRFDLSYTMDMGGFSQPTPADLLYRMLPAMETLLKTQPRQLENRFRLGIAYRWNNDQRPMITTFESLVADIPEHRKTPRAEILLQLAWSRINKVAWNRILHDPESSQAYADAEAAFALAELPLDKFLAEYTMAYSMIFMPDYGDKTKMLRHLTEAKHWFHQIPGNTEAVWRYFLHTERLKPVLDADPLFRTILPSRDKGLE
ncbi:MAG: hypothetical protein OEY86_19755 [Nitrospira sp.]|nr:hypothetical protein [Nitrospira sp.]